MTMINIIINDKQYSAKAGQTILEAAADNGIEIPNLCHDPRLKPTGACRLCVVEVEGFRGPTTACSTVIAPDMVIKTDTELIRSIRKTVLELLFYEHLGVCTTCDENGECKLQRYAYEYQLDDSVFNAPSKGPKEENYTTGNEAIDYDPDKCIRCGRCIRICEEVQMDNALTFKQRAADVTVTTAFDVALNESTCELCGQCISTCPTGALYEKQAKGKAQCKDLQKVRTTCPYCGVGCQIDINYNDKNEFVRATSPTGVIPNDGNLCVKGRFGLDYVQDEKRLTKPLIRKNGELVETSWEDALGVVAEKLRQIKKEYGGDAIAGLSSAKCTNEDNYVFQKFIRAAIGTNNVDHCARLCHASTVAGLARAFGSGAMTNSIEELAHSKCIFIIGSNTTEAHPVIGLVVKDAVVNNGAKLVIADPRTIDMVRFADLHVKQIPGTDVALINAMMNVIIEENLADMDFVNSRCEGFEGYLEVVKDFTPEKAAKITSISADDIRQMARTYATAETASIIYSMGITQHTTGTDNVLSLANLAMLTGNIGRESTGVNPLRGQNNVQGACDLGALPNNYPGYQKVDNPDVHKKFEKAWDAKLSDKIGLTVVEIMHNVLEGKIKALYFMGENPALSDPNLNHTRKALEEVEFLVVQDIFLTETAEYADVVLPAASFAEKDGTFTNTERRVQRVRAALPSPGEARDDWKIICELSTMLGYPMQFKNASQIMDEIALVSPIYGGISFERIDDVGIPWPCLDENHPGTKYLHKDKFSRGLGKFHPVEFRAAAELPSDDYPFVLTTGRQLYQFHTGTMSRKSKAIDQKSPTGYVEINVEDAKALKIKNNDKVKVSTVRGEIETFAMVTENIGKNWLFIPFHFAEAPANILTNDALDPMAKIPELKTCAAAVEKL